MLSPGDEIDVTVEKPAAGGRMIARHEGQVVLVAGTIPGEQVTARIDRVEKRLAFASAVRILGPSGDRREPSFDPLCGGCVYAHIAYERQVMLKSDVIGDAFARIGRIPLPQRVDVRSSPEDAYRMRARLHVRGRTAGFYREGSHHVCDAAATRQLWPDAMSAVETALATLIDGGVDVTSIELSENMAADQRALHVHVSSRGKGVGGALAEAVRVAGLTGCTSRAENGAFVQAGEPRVADPISSLINGGGAGELRRGPESFFQANRFLLPDLVGTVLDAIPAEGEVLDLYAGVGLFSVSLAASGRDHVTAVEGDRASGADLQENAAPYSAAVRAIVGPVEEHIPRRRSSGGTILVDPPRTGISRDAMDAMVHHAARRIVYVSCDPPTLARDARRLLDAGYKLTSLKGFDLFPNTPHVETVGVFDRL